MRIVEYRDGPRWSLFDGWWPYREDHPHLGRPDGHLVVTASRGADKFHYAHITWEARSLHEHWPAVSTTQDGWFASEQRPEADRDG